MDDYWNFDEGQAGADPQPLDTDGDGAADAYLSFEPGGEAMPESSLPPPEFSPDMSFEELTDNLERLEEETRNTHFVDLDGDGRLESVVQTYDENRDGASDAATFQTEWGDGFARPVDRDGDGVADAVVVYEDADGDGVADGVATFEELSPVQPDPSYVEPADEGAYSEREHFDPETSTDVVGDPAADMAHWHQQTYSDTCAVATQEFMLEGVTGEDFSEDALRQEAIDNGWYTPGAGTPMEHMGSLLEAHGLEVERTYGATLDDLGQRLDEGQKVMVSVDSDEIWNPGQDFVQDELLADANGIPGQYPDHAVEVIGIDRSHPDGPMVILNDPGHPEGRGMMVPADEFVNAWQDSGCFMVSAA